MSSNICPLQIYRASGRALPNYVQKMSLYFAGMGSTDLGPLHSTSAMPAQSMHLLISSASLRKAPARMVANIEELYRRADLCERDPAGERGGHAAEDRQAECKCG